MRDEVMSEDLGDLARRVADRIASKCWSVSKDDLRQEAELVAITARVNYDPEKGSLKGYLYKAISRHLINYVYDAGTPVSYKHRRTVLKDIRSAELKEVSYMAAPEDTTAQLEHARWRVRVVNRVEQVAGDDAACVVPCLLGEVSPHDAARAAGLPLLHVMEAVGRVNELLSEDPTLYELFKEMPCQ